MNPLTRLAACGQSPWLDYLTRTLITNGDLARMITCDGLKGMTSNPSIFEKSFAGSAYASAIAAFQTGADHPIAAIYEHLAIADIQAAADALRPIYDETNGRDGYISLECSPYLANNTAATLTEGHRLWRDVDRPNLMVKVPATPAGLPAIRGLIGAGINVNVTLLFSIETYAQVVESYLSGLEDLAGAGGDVSRIASVASFFISRIDTAIDARLAKLGDEQTAATLRGKAAIASGKLAYARYQTLFAGPRWQSLAARGARTQRLLWASTSTKSPEYKDTMYVEALIGRDTVNTMPPSTMDAFRDHGEVEEDAITHGIDEARETLATLERAGISLASVTADLVTSGVQQFAESFDSLFAALALQRRALLDGKLPDLQITPGSDAIKDAIAAETQTWRKTGRLRRLWAGDPALWTGADENNWIGWLGIAAAELADLGQLTEFSHAVQQRGFKHVVLLGMGGSSLGAEVLGQSYGPQPGWPRLHILDSTDPAQIKALEDSIDLTKTLFMVSSKSGGTLEPNIFLDYFFARVAAFAGKDNAGAQFAAVTDPGSPLAARASSLGFADIFYGAPGIGGRYSVLSKFGLAPAAAAGIDVKQLLETAQTMVLSCGADVPPAENPGLQLGIAMGTAAVTAGRNKVTLIASPAIADLAAWLEQLLAESTGKNGRGLVPIAFEPLTMPSQYGPDRFFAYMELEGHEDPAQRQAIADIAQAGHLVARITLKDIAHIGAVFFLWEIATAAAGAIIGIDPFNQPDVESSKQNTSALMQRYETTHKLPAGDPIFRVNGLALYANARTASDLGRHNTLAGYLKQLFGHLQPGGYAALLAYINRTEAHTRTLNTLRATIRDKTHAATCLGFGPRFQHSTGQAYKGGPNTGVFLQITCDDQQDINVPGHAYSFGVVKAAQAMGDLTALEAGGRRAVRIHVKNVEDGLLELEKAVKEGLLF